MLQRWYNFKLTSAVCTAFGSLQRLNPTRRNKLLSLQESSIPCCHLTPQAPQQCQNNYVLPKIGIDTAGHKPQKEPSNRFFLPSRAGCRLWLTKQTAGLCAALVIFVHGKLRCAVKKQLQRMPQYSWGANWRAVSNKTPGLFLAISSPDCCADKDSFDQKLSMISNPLHFTQIACFRL